MEELQNLLNALKKRDFKTFEEASAQLAEVMTLKNAVVAFEKESLTKIVPMTFMKTQQFVTAAKNDLKKLESDANNIVKKGLDDLYANVKSHFTNANQMSLQSRYSHASDSLQKARAALNVLDAPPYNSMDAVKSFVNDYRAQIETAEKKVTDSLTKSLIDDKIREAKMHSTNAKQPLPSMPVTAPTSVETVASDSTPSTPTTTTPSSSTESTAAPVEQTAFVPPIFPKGPIAETLGPWVPHVYPSLKPIVAKPGSSANVLTFIERWNTIIAPVNLDWENAVFDLHRIARLAEKVPLEDLYVPPRKIEGNWNYALGEVKLLQKLVRELPGDEPLRRELMEPVTAAVENLEENLQREKAVSNLVKVLDKASAIYVRLKGEAARTVPRDHTEFIKDVVSDWKQIKAQFTRELIIPVYEERVRKVIQENFAIRDVRSMLSIAEVAYMNIGEEPIHQQERVLEVLKKLEPWPAARELCIRRLTRIWNARFRFNMENWRPEFEPVWPTPTLEMELLQPHDDALGLTRYELIRPGTPEQTGLPFGNQPDQSTKDSDFARSGLPYAGKIVFSSQDIPPYIEKCQSTLRTKFSISDVIKARAVWPRALANYPFAKNKDGTPVYTVEGIMDRKKFASPPHLYMSLQVKIDGKLVCPKYQFQDSIAYWKGSDQLFNYDQSCTFDMLGRLSAFSSELGLVSRLLTGYLLRAGPGTHKVDVALFYNLFDGNTHHQDRKDSPDHIDTLMSHPLAEGSFEVDVPVGAKFPDDFGPTVAEATPFAALKRWMNVIWAKEEGDWELMYAATEEMKIIPFTNEVQVIKTPAKYGKTYSCVYYKPSLNLDYAVYCVASVIAGPNKTWEDGTEEVRVVSTGVSWDPSFLPESLLAKIPNRSKFEERHL